MPDLTSHKFDLNHIFSILYPGITAMSKNRECLEKQTMPGQVCCAFGDVFNKRYAALYERQWMHCKVFVLCVHVLYIKRHARGCFIWGGHRKHSGSGGLPAWRHFYGALLADSNWLLTTIYLIISCWGGGHLFKRDKDKKKQNLVLHCTVHLIKPITLLLLRHICRKYGQNRSKLDKIGQHFYAKKYTAL